MSEDTNHLFYMAIGKVASSAASLENELHRAAVGGLGSSRDAEEFVADITGAAQLVKLFRVTHGGHKDTAGIADRCKAALEKRNHVIHGSPEWVFEGPGLHFRPRWRKRRSKAESAVPTVPELEALAKELGECARGVYVQEGGRSVDWNEEHWGDVL